jgi:hypothetical protein
MSYPRTRSKLPKVQAVKSSKGEVVFHFDPAKVPSRGASLVTRLRFAAEFIRRLAEGQVTSASTLRLCTKWIDEGATIIETKL